MIESLHELSNDIKDYNGKIYFFQGDNLKVLNDIKKCININSIGYNIDYTPYALKRDKEIKEWCLNNKISCYDKEDYLLHNVLDKETLKKDGKPYLVYTPFKNYCIENLTVRKPDKFKKFSFEKNKSLENSKYYIDEKDIDKFYKNNDLINVHGGRSNGLKILKNIKNFKDYSKSRDLLTYKTTFLGAHNHFTTVSIREVYHKVLKELTIKSGIINELYWREFYANITFHFPHILKGQINSKNESYKKEYDKIKWSYNKNMFE